MRRDPRRQRVDEREALALEQLRVGDREQQILVAAEGRLEAVVERGSARARCVFSDSLFVSTPICAAWNAKNAVDREQRAQERRSPARQQPRMRRSTYVRSSFRWTLT